MLSTKFFLLQHKFGPKDLFKSNVTLKLGLHQTRYEELKFQCSFSYDGFVLLGLSSLPDTLSGGGQSECTMTQLTHTFVY